MNKYIELLIVFGIGALYVYIMPLNTYLERADALLLDMIVILSIVFYFCFKSLSIALSAKAECDAVIAMELIKANPIDYEKVKLLT